jgi:hypothetical protein
MALLGRTVLLSVQNINGDDLTDQNNGSPVGVALVTGEDVKGGTVNARVFLDGPTRSAFRMFPLPMWSPSRLPSASRN